MKLTKTIIPLPYSDCLLTESNLYRVSPIAYTDGISLKQAIKVSTCLISITKLATRSTSFRTLKKATNVSKAQTHWLHIDAIYLNESEPSGHSKKVSGVHWILNHGNGTTRCSQNLDGVCLAGRMARR